MSKKNIYILLAVIVFLIIAALIWVGPKTETPLGEIGEGVIKETPETIVSGGITIKEIKKVKVPTIGDNPPKEGVGVPGKVAEGEKEGQKYYVFETELKNGKLDPYELRVKQDDLLGISITNLEDKEHTVHISSENSFIPNFIERKIAPGASGFMRTQVLKPGIYDIICTTCKNEVIGQFIVI